MLTSPCITIEEHCELITKRMYDYLFRIKADFDELTCQLMACKYAYYVQCRPLISDYNYDTYERVWYNIGLTIGELNAGETSPCVGFDGSHPNGLAGKELALKLLNEKGEESK